MAFQNVYRNFSHILRADGFAFRSRRKFGIQVINKTGVTIATDKLVSISGYDTTSKLPKIVLADADASGLSNDVYVTVKSVADGKSAVVFKGAWSASNLNTNSITTAGDPVYLDVTAGGFAVAAPALAGARQMIVGYVQVKSATVGVIAWDIQPPVRLAAADVQGFGALTTFTGDGALTIANQLAYLTKGSAAAISVAAPGTAGIGTRITVTTGTDFAHVVTFTGTTLQDGTAGANTTWTSAAVQGSSITFVGVTATKWNVESFNLGTIAP